MARNVAQKIKAKFLHTYTLTITKEDFSLEFKSKDKKIIEKELGVWINSAANLLEQTLSEKPMVKEEIVPEKIELGNIILDTPKEAQVSVAAPAPPEPIKEKFLTVEEKPRSYKISEETKEILQRAIHKPLPSTNERLRHEEPAKVPSLVEQKNRVIPQAVPPAITPVAEPVSVPEETQDFTTIFNQKIAQTNNSTDRFAQLLSLSNIRNKSDCLVACAYHLVERENFERFTLKQINTLSRALLDEAIDHETLKESLEKRFIKIVPDYTGIATTMEYTLTEQGAQYFKDVIAEE